MEFETLIKFLPIRFEVYFEHQFKRKHFNYKIKINQYTLYFKPRFYIKTNKLSVGKLSTHIWEITWFLLRFWKRSSLPWPKTLFNLKPPEGVFKCILRVLTKKTYCSGTIHNSWPQCRSNSCWIGKVLLFPKLVKNSKPPNKCSD